MKRYLIFILLLLSQASFALVGLDRTILDSKLTSKLRLYNFNRDFTSPLVPTSNSTALGGDLSLLTGDFLIPGLQLGGSFYTSQPLFKNNNPLHVDRALPGFSLTPMGQLYAQYRYKLFFIRAGNQYINTPWMRAVDTRMIPALFQGYYATFGPWEDITFTGLRMFRFKGRAEGAFSKLTLYNPEIIGGSPVPFLRNRESDGALAFGGEYKKKVWNTQVWYYHFYDYAKMGYIDGKYTLKLCDDFQPFIGGQMIQEWAAGANLLKMAHAQAYGALLGTTILKNLTLSAGWDGVPTNRHAFRGGDVVSPFTAGYDDPLYSTSMIGGLIEKAAGNGIKVAAALDLCDKKWQFVASRAHYSTAPFHPNTNETDFDVTYNFSGCLKGLSLRNRVGILTGNPRLGRYVQNRVMLQYIF